MSSEEETSSGSSATDSSSDRDDEGDSSRLDDQLKLLRPTCPQILLDFGAHIQNHAHVLVAQLEEVIPRVQSEDLEKDDEALHKSMDDLPSTKDASTDTREETNEDNIAEKLDAFGKGLMDVMETKLNKLSERMDGLAIREEQVKSGEEKKDDTAQVQALQKLIEEQNAKMKDFADRIASQETKLEEQKRAFIVAAEQQEKDWEMDSLETFNMSLRSAAGSASSSEEHNELFKRVQDLRLKQLDSDKLERQKQAIKERISGNESKEMGEDKENSVSSLQRGEDECEPALTEIQQLHHRLSVHKTTPRFLT